MGTPNMEIIVDEVRVASCGQLVAISQDVSSHVAPVAVGCQSTVILMAVSLM